MGKGSDIPECIQGWNWGAFLLNWIWAIFNKTWIGLLCLIPYLGIFMLVYLGIYGNKLAWQNKRWASIEEFQRIQKLWAIAGLLVNIAFITGAFIFLKFINIHLMTR